jgi:hypothetical protein
MHHGFALRYISQVMGWSPTEEDIEIAWLRLMSEFKYDGYHDFLAGSRFVEALLDWLQQFAPAHRPLFYRLLKERLIFISSAELQHLVRRTYPAYVYPRVEARVARQIGVPRYQLGRDKDHLARVDQMTKRTLFVGLSDGARLDLFRRANAGVLSNEQVIPSYEVADPKWEDLHKELKERTGDPKAAFELVVLLDDFTASGTTLVWQDANNYWKGKLKKTSIQLKNHRDALTTDYDLLIHHYIGTSNAGETIRSKLDQVRGEPQV